MLRSAEIIQGSMALLAFVFTFYILISKERKTPYSAMSVYWIVYMVGGAILFAIFSIIMGDSGLAQWSYGHQWYILDHRFSLISKFAQILAHLLLILAIVYFIYRVLRMHDRDKNLRDDFLFRMLKSPKKGWKKIFHNKRDEIYNHTAAPLSLELVQKAKLFDNISNIEEAFSGNGRFGSFVMVVHANVKGSAGRNIISLAEEFLKKGNVVQYTTALRHPYEFIDALKGAFVGQKWENFSKNIVVVDAYTPHFGFGDSIHREYSKKCKQEVLTFITSEPTYAGIHTAAAVAYNSVKDLAKEGERNPALIIYEGMHALIDLESSEQYRIFCRHVLPSEKLWGGMFTLFVESTVDEANLSVLRDHADLYVCLADDVVKEKEVESLGVTKAMGKRTIPEK